MPDAVLRVAVDTDEAGLVTSVTLVQLDQAGDFMYTWPVWTKDVASIEDAPLPEGVELGEPDVRLPEDDIAADQQADDEQQGKGNS
jgi:hypothetical protein